MNWSRIDPRIRRPVVLSIAGAIGALTLTSVIFPEEREAGVDYTSSGTEVTPTSSAVPTSPIPEPSYYSGSVASDPHRREYAIPLVELPGLSPQSPSGTVFELWVAWDPALTDSPQVEMLFKKVRLESIVVPPVAEGPYLALISVKRNQVEHLILGDRFGDLSAVTLP